MPGTVIFKPIQATFKQDEDKHHSVDPYCKFKVGRKKAKTSVIEKVDGHAEWNEAVKLERKDSENIALLKIKDKDMFKDDTIGKVQIDLKQLGPSGKMTQWFEVKDHGKITGEILLDIEYVPK